MELGNKFNKSIAESIAEINDETKVNGYIFTMCYKDKHGKQHHVSQKFDKYETAKAVYDVMHDLIKGTISWIDVREAE